MFRRHRSDLLVLEDATRRLRPSSRRHLGVRPIPVRQIVGTDSRGADFDRDFAPRRADVRRRLHALAEAFPDGHYPPIVVHQLGDAFFVLDGHHRVALARRQGIEHIDAEVTILRSRWRLGADADAEELVHAEQERLFMEQSGLGLVAPELLLRVTRPVGYRQLLEAVRLHGFQRMQDDQRLLQPREIAADWYETVYLPAVDAFRKGGRPCACAGATEPDVFLHAIEQRRELLAS
jgi:hypothetical protein